MCDIVLFLVEQFKNVSEDAGVEIIMRLGSWNDSSQMRPSDFSEILGDPKKQEKFKEALINYGSKSKLPIKGILFSWYYPTCPMVNSKFHYQNSYINLIRYSDNYFYRFIYWQFM